MRDAPSIYIIEKLEEHGAKIKAFDPVACQNASRILKNVTYCNSPKDAATGVDALLVLTEWNEFKQLNLSEIKNAMKSPYLFDGRNVYEPEKLKALGFNYKGIGRS